MNGKISVLLPLFLAFGILAGGQTPEVSAAGTQETSAAPTVETLVCVRHGEKTPTELGQLDFQGLNRSLALPKVLVGKYGKPGYIFAPDPDETIGHDKGVSYCYVRPLATIEPTAIYCGMPVNALIGYRHIQDLETEIEKSQYQNSVIFIAWEHLNLEKFVRQVVIDHGGDGRQVPKWKGSDYDSIYVVKLTRKNGPASVSFNLDHENLDNLGTSFPGP